MTIIGILLLVSGAGGFLALFTGAGGPYLPVLAKMPLGLGGWAILGVIGLTLIVLYRRPTD
jgi:hypothetical protein